MTDRLARLADRPDLLAEVAKATDSHPAEVIEALAEVVAEEHGHRPAGEPEHNGTP